VNSGLELKAKIRDAVFDDMFRLDIDDIEA